MKQSERSAQTRTLVLEAALAVLEEEGLRGATTVRIQRRAGVSRGRLLHHYPSREQLLVAAVQRFAQLQLESLAESGADQLFGMDRMRFAIDRLWATYQGPLFWVAMELWIGARTDSGLREVLLPQERHLGSVIDALCDRLFGEDLAARPGFAGLRDVLISSMRGVAMTYALEDRPMATDRHREAWYDQARRWLEGDGARPATTPATDRSPRA